MYPFIKRIFDIAASLAACILLLPLFIAVAVAIRLETPGPAIFRQQRIGLHGRPFAILKFRSMVRDAPSLGSWQTAKGDPRITRVGRFLRLTSLDELPQLGNVLMGDMSLIGPRPEVPAREASYAPADWQLRHHVRPGITGLAQVNGRSNLPDDKQLRYDLEYAAQPNWRMDMRILLKTFQAVLRRTGVN